MLDICCSTDAQPKSTSPESPLEALCGNEFPPALQVCLRESDLRRDSPRTMRADDSDNGVVPSERSTIDPSERASDLGSPGDRFTTPCKAPVADSHDNARELRNRVNRFATPCKSAMVLGSCSGTPPPPEQ